MTTLTSATMSTRALDALTVIEAATAFGLPQPFDVTFSTHRLSAVVGSYDELAAWADHLGAEVTSGFTYPDGRRLFTIRGTIAGAEVGLFAVAAVAS